MNCENYNYPVDLVYLWCDDSDEKWHNKRLKYLANEKKIKAQAIKGRFESHDELKYSLRSVEKNIPWINHVYIVTDEQTPSFLKLPHHKISIVSHKEIIPEKYLPLFNSSAIEFGLANIPGLSEHFLYANDDMLFTAPHNKDFYFTKDDKPIYRVTQTIKKLKKYHIPLTLYWLLCRFRPNILKSIYDKNLLNCLDLIKSQTNQIPVFYPGHGIDPYRKSLLLKYNAMPCMQSSVEKTILSRFRHRTDLQRHIYALWGFVFNEIEFTDIEKIVFPGSKCYTKDDIDLALISSPLLFEKEFTGKAKQMCLNDTEFSDPDFGKNTKALLERLFPEKSQFER